VAGNPKAEVEIRVSPDGTIVGRRLVRSSGVAAWDEAVLRAIDKAGALPRDIDGRVQNPTLVVWGPQD
jgi:colicin import membrane protein